MTVTNVLWINLDQIRYDTLGVNGNPLGMTPRMDQLAREGVNFSRAYTPCSLCTPARGSMLTGRYAFIHGLGTNHDMFHPIAQDLPHPEMLLHPRLQERGYRTGYVGKWHVGSEKGPVDYGYEGMNIPKYGNPEAYEGFQQYIAQHGYSYEKEAIVNGWFNEHVSPGGVWHGSVESTPQHYLANYTMEMVDELRASGPFFVMLNYWGPHVPHYPSDQFFGSCDRNVLTPWKNFDSDLSSKPDRIRRESAGVRTTMGAEWDEWKELVGLYYDFVHEIDFQIGRIIDHLTAAGLMENTLVAVTADHGDMAGSHMLVDKGFPYEEAHHIPLIIRPPDDGAGLALGSNRGRSCDDLAFNMDLFPTVLEMAGVPDSSLDGQSLLGAIGGAPDRDKRSELYLEFHGLRALYSQRTLLTDDGLKYVFTPGAFDEVYDLAADPSELRNLLATSGEPAAQARGSGVDGEKVEGLRRRLHSCAQLHGDPLERSIAQYFNWT